MGNADERARTTSAEMTGKLLHADTLRSAHAKLAANNNDRHITEPFQLRRASWCGPRRWQHTARFLVEHRAHQTLRFDARIDVLPAVAVRPAVISAIANAG